MFGPFSLILPAVLMVCFLVYWLGSLFSYLRRPACPRGDAAAFDWHVFVPCRDEEAVIGETVRHMRRHFPAARMWVVDDHSEDRTAAIVADLAAHDDHIELIQRRRPNARTGKGDALNLAYRRLDEFLRAQSGPRPVDRTRTIVCVLDADGRLDPGTLDQVSGPTVFGDPRIGGAQIGIRLRNIDDARPLPRRGRLLNALARLLIRLQDIELRVSSGCMQLLRDRAGSVGLGGNGQFTRLSALDAVAWSEGPPWRAGALVEDYELGIRILLNGYQLTHVHDTFVAQEGLPHARRLLTQRTRWSQGNMQCLRYAPRAISSRNFRMAAVAETVYTLVQPFAYVMLLLMAVGTALGWLGAREGHLVASWPVLAGLTALSSAPFVVAGLLYRRDHTPDHSLAATFARGIALWFYSYHLFPVSTRAVGRLLVRRNSWAKTKRNAELLPSAAPQRT